MQITVIGAGCVGLVTGVSLASLEGETRQVSATSALEWPYATGAGASTR